MWVCQYNSSPKVPEDAVPLILIFQQIPCHCMCTLGVLIVLIEVAMDLHSSVLLLRPLYTKMSRYPGSYTRRVLEHDRYAHVPDLLFINCLDYPIHFLGT